MKSEKRRSAMLGSCSWLPKKNETAIKMKTTLAERFWSKVDLSLVPEDKWPRFEPNNPPSYDEIYAIGRMRSSPRLDYELCCWWWTGGKSAHKSAGGAPYGGFREGSRMRLAHRVAWELANKQKIPAGMQINHRCDHTLCVNPYHLYLGTSVDNARDRDRDKTLVPMLLHPATAEQLEDQMRNAEEEEALRQGKQRHPDDPDFPEHLRPVKRMKIGNRIYYVDARIRDEDWQAT